MEIMNIFNVYNLLLSLSLYFIAINFVLLGVVLLLSVFRRKVYGYKYVPSVSVVIPFYNEQDNVETCLQHVLASEYPKEKLEVICVDDGSTDLTRSRLRKFEKKYSCLKLLLGHHRGKSAAFNLGAEYVRSEIIIGLDADTTIGSRYIREAVKPLANPEISFVVTPLLCRPDKSIWGHLQAIEYAFLTLIRGAFARVTGYPIWLIGAVLVIRSGVFRKVGRYRTEIANDFDLLLNLHASGYKAAFCPQVVAHTRAVGFQKFIRQRMRWNYGAFLVLKNHWFLISRSWIYLFLVFAYLLWVFNSILFVSHFVFLMTLNVLFKGYFLFGQLLYLTNFAILSHVVYDIRPRLLVVQLFIFAYYGGGLWLYDRRLELRRVVAFLLLPLYFFVLHITTLMSFVKYVRMRSNRWRW